MSLALLLIVLGGRLVFWMPSAPGLYEETELPMHPVMPIIYNR